LWLRYPVVANAALLAQYRSAVTGLLVAGDSATARATREVTAAFLAWLWPGAGHLYQQRYAKGILFMVCILATFFYGMHLGQGRVVFIYGDWKPERFRWPFLCQVWVGLPALPAPQMTSGRGASRCRARDSSG
jgi:hypothetical protein